jgi:hypothetical protein
MWTCAWAHEEMQVHIYHVQICVCMAFVYVDVCAQMHAWLHVRGYACAMIIHTDDALVYRAVCTQLSVDKIWTGEKRGP